MWHLGRPVKCLSKAGTVLRSPAKKMAGKLAQKSKSAVSSIVKKVKNAPRIEKIGRIKPTRSTKKGHLGVMYSYVKGNGYRYNLEKSIQITMDMIYIYNVIHGTNIMVYYQGVIFNYSLKNSFILLINNIL